MCQKLLKQKNSPELRQNDRLRTYLQIWIILHSRMLEKVGHRGTCPISFWWFYNTCTPTLFEVGLNEVPYHYLITSNTPALSSEINDGPQCAGRDLNRIVKNKTFLYY